MQLQEKIRSLPAVPGVYLMKDSLGVILYVGKSKNLKKRVQSYFYHFKAHAPKIKKLVHHVKDIEHIPTDTEFEAFILECKLIREIKPLYNKKMKNPNAYTYIVIRQKEGLQRIQVTNDPDLPGGQFKFGPYTASKSSVEGAVRGIQDCFKIYCNHSLPVKSPCLNHSLGLCLGMCLGGNAIEEYNWIMNRFIALFQGTDRSLYEEMKQKMLAASENCEFEKAVKYRDYIEAADFLLKKEKVMRFTEENLNIAVVESLSEDTFKLFLIKRSKVLYRGKFSTARKRQMKAKIKEVILEKFGEDEIRPAMDVSRHEIDEAQIIYSYLQSSGVKHLLIPQEWLEYDNPAYLDDALQSFLCGW
ncbi:GIY-YIG nuclease family protein [Paenibacillus sp. FJAT-26967]|uniref:GIY-YIG nuclease family protein n=1 Tax=Paenibacillus sp. FJAT-26967 TaxID=1729690 RepID=UPI000AB2399B|nr:GIY-YIG nuclease family protein [Paenibacillus sp. FJAT-26967]